MKEEKIRLKEKEDLERSKALYEGKVSYLADWSGAKDSMPPENMDNFG